jgi:C4-dicarboxylate-specific signal transduction histidine kinase
LSLGKEAQLPATIRRRQIGLALLTLVAVSCLSIGAWHVAYLHGLADIERQVGDRLAVNLRSVEGATERYRYLPGVVGKDPRIGDLLQLPLPQTVEAANAYLKSVRELSGLAELFVLDVDGQTIASSNWNEPDSFIGHNYAFRPYFADAIATGEGRFYAVGVTSGQPGYYFSSRFEVGGRTLGVVVAKADMTPLARDWAGSEAMSAIADRDGVVFLSGDPGLTYRPLAPLDAETIARLEAQRRYDGVNLVSADPLLLREEGNANILVTNAGERFLLAGSTIEPDGWQVLEALPLEPVEQQARVVGGAVALLSILGIVAGGVLIHATRGTSAPAGRQSAQPVQLSRVLDTAMDRLAAKARNAGVVVTAVWEPGLKPVSGDPVALEQVFLHLIRNAIAASATAGSASVRVIAHGLDTNTVVVDIVDAGTRRAKAEGQGGVFPMIWLGRGNRAMAQSQAILDTLGGSLSDEGTADGGRLTRVTLPVHHAPGRAEKRQVA